MACTAIPGALWWRIHLPLMWQTMWVSHWPAQPHAMAQTQPSSITTIGSSVIINIDGSRKLVCVPMILVCVPTSVRASVCFRSLTRTMKSSIHFPASLSSSLPTQGAWNVSLNAVRVMSMELGFVIINGTQIHCERRGEGRGEGRGEVKQGEGKGGEGEELGLVIITDPL